MTPEEQQAQLDAMFGVSPTKKKKKEFDATEYENILSSGDEGKYMEYMIDIGEDSPSVINAGLKSLKERNVLKKTEAQTFDLVSSDLNSIDNLLKDGKYEWLGGNSNDLLGKFGLSVIPGMDGFGGAQADLEKIIGGVFLQQVPQMQNLGALSDSEGKTISDAFTALKHALPNADGSYKSKMPEEDIKNNLMIIKEQYEKIKRRTARGLRVDPETGEEITQDQMATRYPKEDIPQGTTSTTANHLDLKGSKMTVEELNAAIAEFSKNAKLGDRITLPDGQSHVKRK